MRNISRLAAIAVVVIGLSASAQAAKKKTFDFSEFRGNYSGTALVSAGAFSLPGTAFITVTVPKSGKSAVVNVTTSFVESGTPYTFTNTFTFAGNKTFTQAKLIWGILGANDFPVSGTYGGKKTLSFSGQVPLSSTAAATTQGTLSARPQGKKHRRLILTSQLSIPGSPETSYSFTFDVTAKVKPPKK